MSILIGPAVISTGEPDWPAQRAIVRAMGARIARIRTPIGFGFTPERAADLIADGVHTMVLGGEDGDVTPERTEHDLSRWLPLIDAHPQVRFIVELGNEPNIVAGMDIWRHRYDALRTLTELRPALGRPQLQWAISLPTALGDTKDLLARDSRGCILDHVDVVCPHLYGWYEVGDGGGGEWPQVYEFALATGKPLILTELGIDDRATPKAEKAKRYLRWLDQAPAAVVGACIWGLGDWSGPGRNETYELDLAMAAVLRAGQEEEPDMPKLWYPDAVRYTAKHQNRGADHGRRWPGTVTTIVEHHTVGSWSSVVNTFTSGSREASAHFLVGRDGRVAQFVSLGDIAWHANNWPVNVASIGIEHEHYQLPGGGWSSWTDAQLDASARLHHWLRARMPSWNIRRHSEVSATSTACPADLPIAEILRRMAALDQSTVAPDVREFPETGHSVGGGFLRYWEKHGGLPVFGYPITGEFEEDGIVVQYFERARLEWHPDDGHGDPDDWHVVRGRVGAELWSLKQG